MDTSAWVTLAVSGFFALLALLVFVRLLTRKVEPVWREIRIGFFIERITQDDLDESLRPTTLMRPEK